MRNLLLAASAALALSACTNPDGSIDYGNTALLGAGGGAAALMLGAALKGDDPQPQYHQHGRYGRKPAAYGYQQPYRQQYAPAYQQPYPQPLPPMQPYPGWRY